MAWTNVDHTDKDTVRLSVDCAVSNARHHEVTLGTTDEQKEDSVVGIQTKMDPARSNGIAYVKLMTNRQVDVGHGSGRVSVFFHKMKWMSTYGVRSDVDRSYFGDVWVVTVAFNNDVLPHKGSNGMYRSLIGKLTKRTAPRGPLAQFRIDNSVDSLYVVGPVGASGTPSDDRRIGQLEREARFVFNDPQSKWQVFGTTTINKAYMGKDPLNGDADIAIEQRILDYWGEHHVGTEFDLTELRYTP